MAIKIALCLISSLILWLSFLPQPYFGILVYFGLVPMLMAIHKASFKKAAVLGQLTGFCFFLLLLCWIPQVEMLTLQKKILFLGWFILSLFLGLSYSIFSVIFCLLERKLKVSLPIAAASVWVILEFVRNYFPWGGFPWGSLCYSQAFLLPIIQIASITGSFGISFLIVLCNVAIFQAIAHRNIKFLTYFLIVILVIGFGVYRLKTFNLPKTKAINVAIIQIGLEFEDKKIFNYLKDTCQQFKNIELIVLPESTFAQPLNINHKLYQQINNIAKAKGALIIVGAPARIGGMRHNSAYLIHPNLALSKRYDKILLVPFGEYAPHKIFEKLTPTRYFPGNKMKLFEIDTINFATLICFEGIFDYFPRALSRKGAQFFINITNDSWSKNSLSYWQHLSFLPFRAVEGAKFFLRAGYNGISAVISPTGKILKKLNINQKGYIIHTIYPNSKFTIYESYGEWFLVFCILAMFAIFFYKLSKKGGRDLF